MGLTQGQAHHAVLRVTLDYGLGAAGAAGAAGAGVVGVAGAVVEPPAAPEPVVPVLGEELCVWPAVLPVVLGSLLPPS